MLRVRSPLPGRGHQQLSDQAARPFLPRSASPCMDRYMDAWNTVSRAYNSRLQRERANM